MGPWLKEHRPTVIYLGPSCKISVSNLNIGVGLKPRSFFFFRKNVDDIISKNSGQDMIVLYLYWTFFRFFFFIFSCN